MSYTDYLNRKKINSPVLIDARMKMPDASSFTWRTKLAATSINRRTDHVINNSQDTPAPRLFSPAAMGYQGSGFGGRVQDASSFTLAQSALSLRRDVFAGPSGRHRTPTNASEQCLTFPPASQVVSEFGNSEKRSTTVVEESSLAGLNMGYSRQRIGNREAAGQVGQCTSNFAPQTKSFFVDTIPELKLHKVGTAPQPVTTQSAGGRQNVQNRVSCPSGRTTTTGVGKTILPLQQDPKDHVQFNSYSPLPNNSFGSGQNVVHRSFVTGIQGPQVGGQTTGGVRADKVGGASPLIKHSITHRGWGGQTRTPYPHPRVPPTGAPAQLKINEPTHYKI
jgi:hypothetical protein